MPKKILDNWTGFDVWQKIQSQDEAADLIPGGSFASTLSFVEGAANVYDKDGKLLQPNELQEYIAIQQQKKRDGENVSNDVFYLQDLEDETEMYELTVEYGKLNPRLTLNDTPLKEADRNKALRKPQVEQPVVQEPQAEQPVAQEPQAEQPVVEQPQAEEPVEEEPQKKTPEEASVEILEAFFAYKQIKESMFPNDEKERDWEAASSTYFGLLGPLKDAVTVYDKDGFPMEKEDWQNQIFEKQQNHLDGKPASNDTFYLRSDANTKVAFPLTVSYDGKTPTMAVADEPLSKEAWNNVLNEAAEKKASAVDRFFAAWKEVEDFKKTPGMENRGMDVLSVNKLNRALKTVQEVTFVSDKDGNPITGDMWTSLLTAKQTTYEKGEKVPKETFYLRCKYDVSKMFKLSVEFGKTKPTFALNKTPLSDKERTALESNWNAEKTAQEAFKEARVDLTDLRARREQIANAPERLLGAFKGIEEIRKAPDFKRPNIDVTAMELRKNLENVQGIANVCDASGKALDGDAWYERIAQNELMRKGGERVPEDTFYLTCKDDNSKMFKVTVEYGRSKPKFKIDKTPVYEDERWRLRGEWQKNAVQADVVDPNAEDSPEKQNQKEKTAVAAKNVEKGAAIEKNAEKVAKNATETVITPSLDERVRAAGKDEHGYTQPSWKKYDVNAKKAGSGVVMEMAEMKPLEEEAAPQKPKAEELQETKKILRTVEERDFSRIQTNLERSLNPILDQKSPKELPKEAKLAESFCKEIKDAAKENDSVRTMLVNMETPAMQALYADYCEDVKKGVDPQLKGVLNETLRLDEAAKNGVAHEAPDRNADLLSESNEYHPIPNNADMEEENKQIEEIQVGPQAGGV